MTLIVGETYKSQYHGRHIKVISIDSDTPGSYGLSVMFVDPSTGEEDPDFMYIDKSDVNGWKKVS